jgi:hypothetical protein
MATNRLEHGLRAEKTNRCIRDVVTLYLNVMFTALMVKDAPAEQSLSCDSVDAREITNLGIAGRIRNEVVSAWGDATRCTSVHDERWRRGGGSGIEGRFKEERK